MKKKVTVFGSYAVDLTSTAAHLPKPGETVFGSRFRMGQGGKGSNQAVAAHRADADVTFITKLGKDFFGDQALEFYKKEKMNVDYILRDSQVHTGTALICVDENSGQNQILVVPGACSRFTEEDIHKIAPVIQKSDILLTQLEVNLDALEKVIEIAKQSGVKTVLNSAPIQKISDEMLRKINIITPNEVEAEGLTGVHIKHEKDAQKAAQILHGKGIESVIITMGELGVFVSSGGDQKMIPSYKVDVVDTTGAGDAFNGGFVTALSEGLDIFKAAEFGNKAGALSVTKFGTAPAMPYRSAIDAFNEII